MRAGAPAAFAFGLALACAETPAVPPGPPPGPAAFASGLPAELVALLPASIDSLLVIEMEQVRGSSFTRPLLAGLRAEGHVRVADRSLRGFDEVADVDRFVIARFGRPGGERATFELALGRFKPSRLEAAFRERHADAAPTRFGATEGLTGARHGLALFGPEVAAFGPPWALREAAAVKEGRAPSARGAAWLTAAEKSMPAKLRAAGAPAIAVYLRESPATRAELTALLEEEPPPLEHLAVRFELGEAAHLYLVATSKSAEDAAVMAGRVREALTALDGRPSLEALGLAPTIARASVAARDTRMLAELGVSEADRARVARKLAVLGTRLLGPRGQPAAAAP